MTGALRSSDAVSQVLGYIIMVTIMFMFFIMVYAIGYPIYNDNVNSNHVQNMEKSFSVLSYNANLVARQKLMTSSTEIKMYDGVLTTWNTGALSMNISYYRDVGGTNLIGSSGKYYFSALEYIKGTTRVAYIDSSVCRYDLNGVAMLEKPVIVNGPGFMLIPMVNLYESNVSIASDSLVRMTFMTPYYSKTSQIVGSPGPSTVPGVKNITIQLAGDYAPSFSRYFRDELQFTESAGPNGIYNLSKRYTEGMNLTIIPRSDVSVQVY